MSRARLAWAAVLAVAHGSVSTTAAAQRRTNPQDQQVLSHILAGVSEHALRSHATFLADDLLEGRRPGTRGGMLAARYLASQFAILGLQPAAPNGTFFQSVEMVGLTPEASFVVGSGRRTTAFAPLEDYVAWPERPDSSVTVDGDVVFVGHGITAPEWDWDDFKGTSLVGKILLFLADDPGVTDPEVFDGRSMTYYGWWSYKLEQAARTGAVGAIMVHRDEVAPQSWGVIRDTWSGERLLARTSRLTTLRFAAWITATAARRLAATAGVDFDDLARRAAARSFAPIELGAHAAMHIRSRTRVTTAVNVVARLDGQDPERRHQALLYVAHYDDARAAQPTDTDSGAAGAVDDAAGAAALLATAAAFAPDRAQLRRSLIFLATTATSPNLLGARAYVATPAVPLEHTVAVLNIDGTTTFGPTQDVVALGAAASTLDSAFVRAAAAEGLDAAEDPWAEGGRFFASDHFPFARAGVPALQLAGGTRYLGRPETWGLARLRARLAGRRQQAGEESPGQPDFAGVLQQVRLLIRLGWALARTDQFPMWHRDSPHRPAGEQLRFLRERAGRP